MRYRRVEFVARAIQVGGDDERRALVVLTTVNLGQHQQCFFGDAVRRIRFFGIAIPNGLFAKRHWRELRITTDGAQDDSFFHPSGAGRFDYVHAHLQVVQKQRCWLYLVIANAAHPSCEVNHMTRSMRSKQLISNTRLGEIVVGMAWGGDHGTLVGESGNDMAA